MSDRIAAVVHEHEDELKCLAWAGRGPRALSFQPRSAAMSAAAHISLVLLLFTVQVATKPKTPRRTATLLYYVTPVVTAPAPARPKITAPRLAPPAPLRASTTLPPPRLPAPPVLELPATRPVAAPIDPLPKPAPPALSIRTEIFASAAPAVKSSAAATAPQIRTGGFDAPQSTAVKQPIRDVQIAAAGFGDSGAAPAAGARRTVSAAAGFGDITGQSASRPAGVVQTAGFGESAAASNGSPARAAVRAGGFGDTVASATGPSASRPAAEAPVTAAQILDKPKPAYTDEARRLQIQGAVQLEVAFRASGKIEVLRVVRGLGHGLDESAAAAARGIRFLPARREGQPVDSTATVHILFQLAS